MTQALLIHGTEQKTVTVEETADGGLIVWLSAEDFFRLEPVASSVVPGIIRATEDAIPLETFSHIQVSDLDGKYAKQRKALIYLRFRTDLKFKDGVGAFDDVDGYMFESWEKYVPSLMSDKPLSQLEQDLIMLQRSERADLFKKNGKVNQTVAAEILGIPNGGKANYPRLQAVARELENPTNSTLLEGDTDNLFGKK
jgi:hypothetical protein